MKDRIVLVHFYCKDCNDTIGGSINSPKELKNKTNGYTYTQIRCPYCKKTYYLKNENGKPIDAVGELNEDDILTDEDNSMFE